MKIDEAIGEIETDKVRLRRQPQILTFSVSNEFCPQWISTSTLLPNISELSLDSSEIMIMIDNRSEFRALNIALHAYG